MLRENNFLNTIKCKSEEVDFLSKNERYKFILNKFRDSEYAYLACDTTYDVKALHKLMISTLIDIGNIGIPEGIAVAMHSYMLSAIATVPLNDSSLETKRSFFLDLVKNNHYLVANTGSDSTTRSNNANLSEVITKAQPVIGGYTITGEKTFVSMANIADLLIFTATLPNGAHGFFVTPLKQEGIKIGKPNFSLNYELQTHSIKLDNIFVSEEMALIEHSSTSNSVIHTYQRAWFQSLISAVYLGASSRALYEAAKFSQNIKIGNSPLSTLDGTLLNLGRLHGDWYAALACSKVCADYFYTFLRNPNEQNLHELFVASIVAKRTGCTQSRQIVQAVCDFVGTRSMEEKSILSEIANLVGFGVLHPLISAQADRMLGSNLLNLSK